MRLKWKTMFSKWSIVIKYTIKFKATQQLCHLIVNLIFIVYFITILRLLNIVFRFNLIFN
jgi:hypothetical protein